jgi:pyruvate formate lyase activating enzyme
MFKGIQKLSLVDFPDVIATTLFTGGCNFRCNWCYNFDLVLPERLSRIKEIPESEVKDFLLERKGKIEGVCITGGEPTIWGERLADFLNWCKKNGFLVKLDTNGYLPEVLQDYIEKKLLDFIAMDIKNTFKKYSLTCGVEIDIKKIKDSIKIIKESSIKHQFRTTLVPELVSAEEMKSMEEFIGEKLVFQEFLDPSKKY